MMRRLARMYGWGPEVVERLTTQQVLMYLSEDGSDESGGTRTFKTYAEYEAWRARRGAS